VTDANVSRRASDFLEMAKPCVVLDVNLKRPAADAEKQKSEVRKHERFDGAEFLN
jgi:hypothetical protein